MSCEDSNLPVQASKYTSGVGAENPAQCGHSLRAKNLLIIKCRYNTERGYIHVRV